MRNMTRGWLTLLALALTSALGIATAPAAAAYAAGNSTWGVVCAFGKCIPSGTLLHVIDGRGIALSYDRAQATSGGSLCNWWIDFDYYDIQNNRYRHVQGAAHQSCTHNGYVRIDYPAGPYRWETGRACATLYSSSIYLTRQCHYLHP